MSLNKSQSKTLSSREKFVESAKAGKILANRCSKCNNLVLETVYYCNNCYSKSFKPVEYNGVGKVITYTIQAVAPQGFEDVNSYAWVVFKLDECELNVSGFLPGVSSPSDLPLGTAVKVIDYHDKHGLILQKI